MGAKDSRWATTGVYAACCGIGREQVSFRVCTLSAQHLGTVVQGAWLL